MAGAIRPDQVADLLNIREATFRKKWRTLVRHHGFPAPLPVIKLRWSEQQVINWIDASGVITSGETATDTNGKDIATVVAKARGNLEARYAAAS